MEYSDTQDTTRALNSATSCDRSMSSSSVSRCSSSTKWATSPSTPRPGRCFALVSSRYERRSLIVSSNKSFSAWGEIFGDPVAVAAMVDRLVHHAEVIVLRDDSYRLKGKNKEVLDPEKAA